MKFQSLILLPTLLIAACSSMPKTVEKPDLALRSLDIQGATLTDATVLLNLEIRNPNSFALDVDSVKYGLDIDGKAFANGSLPEGGKIPANGSTTLSVPLRMKYVDLFSQFSNLLKKQGTSTYQIHGTVSAHDKEFPFQHLGEVKIPG